MADKSALATAVSEFIAALPDESRRDEALVLCEVMSRASGEAAYMWGSSIIGFGTQHYRYESGREGDEMIVGLAPRKAALTVYGLGAIHRANDPLLEELGPYTTGKGCLYLKRLDGVNLAVFEKIVAKAVAARRQ